MKSARACVFAILLIVGGCASTTPIAPPTKSSAPEDQERAPREIEEARATLAQNAPIGSQFNEALAQADRLGLTCYPASHIFIDLGIGISIGLAYCTPSCDLSVTSRWWIRVSDDASSKNIEEPELVRGDSFAPNSCGLYPIHPGVRNLAVGEITYTGSIFRGVPDGNGTGTWKDGTRYEGAWANGHPEGRGKM